MTYCCALRLEQGLVFISDTRTNAGSIIFLCSVNCILFGVTGERFIALQTAGNLATTQAVIGHLQNALILQQEPNLYSINTMFEVADLVGKTLKSVLEDISSDTQEQMNYACSILVGGQIKGGDMQLYNVYPQGNFICATTDTPYFQIGESKYGKPILDRALYYAMPLDDALRCSLISFDSTLRSNVSVGLPLDALVYSKDSFVIPMGKRITEDDPYFSQISRQWSDTLRRGLQEMPKPTDDYWR